MQADILIINKNKFMIKLNEYVKCNLKFSI